MFTYTIDENNAIWGYAPEQEVACLFQPDWPDSTPWADRAEAESWATQWANHMNDPENNAFPANKPGS